MWPCRVAQRHGRLRRRPWLRQPARPDVVETEEGPSSLAVALAEGVVACGHRRGLAKPRWLRCVVAGSARRGAERRCGGWPRLRGPGK
jgi:hypothetical protein